MSVRPLSECDNTYTRDRSSYTCQKNHTLTLLGSVCCRGHALTFIEVKGYESRVQHVERVNQTVLFRQCFVDKTTLTVAPVICFGVDTDQSFFWVLRTLTQRSAPFLCLIEDVMFNGGRPSGGCSQTSCKYELRDATSLDMLLFHL